MLILKKQYVLLKFYYLNLSVGGHFIIIFKLRFWYNFLKGEHLLSD